MNENKIKSEVKDYMMKSNEIKNSEMEEYLIKKSDHLGDFN